MDSIRNTDSLEEVLGGSIRVRGYVDIINGSYEQLHKKNHFTIPLFLTLVNMMGNSSSAGAGAFGAPPSQNWNTGTSFTPIIALGTDTTTPTKIGMVNLCSPIGFPPLAPNGKSGSTGTLSNGAQVTYSATWNSGTASGTVGEVGLYLWFMAQSYQAQYPMNPWGAGALSFGAGAFAGTTYNTIMMSSRLSAADTDFTAFAINTAAPLSINWSIQLTFT